MTPQELPAALEECVAHLPTEYRAEALDDAAIFCKRIQQKFGLLSDVACRPNELELKRVVAYVAGGGAAGGNKPELMHPAESGLQDLRFFRSLAKNVHAPYHYLAYVYLGFLQGWADA